MKTKLLCICIAMAALCNTYAQDWEYLGPVDYNQLDDVSNFNLNSKDIPYAITRTTYYKACVKKYENGQWQYVGNPEGISDLPVYANYNTNLNIEFSTNDVPYIAYVEYSYNGGSERSNTIVVKKYNGTDWETVGDKIINSNVRETPILKLILDHNNVPYVLFENDEGGSSARYSKIKTFNGAFWVDIPGEFYEADIAVDSQNVLHVAYADIDFGDPETKGIVRKFNGSTWETVGNLDFTEKEPRHFNLEFSSTDVPYVAYKESGYVYNWDEISVQYLNSNGIWTYLGDPASLNSTSSGGEVPFVIDENDIPSILAENKDDYDERGIYKFNGFIWNLSQVILDSYKDLKLVYDSNNVPLVYNTESYMNGIHKLNSSNTWDYLGTFGFTTEETGYFDENQTNTTYNTVFSAIYKDIRYVAYTIGSDSNQRVRVKKFENGQWSAVGDTDFDGDAISAQDIVVDSYGVPYLVYRNTDDWSRSYTEVRKFNGTSWEFVGTPSPKTSITSKLILDHNDMPYLLVYENFINVLKRFDGTNWSVVTHPDFGDNFRFDLAVDSMNNLYVHVPISVSPGVFQSKVFKLNASDDSWDVLAEDDLVDGRIVDIKTDKNDKPYVAIITGNYEDSRLTVKAFSNNSWQTVGQTNVSNYWSQYGELAFDSENTPYLCYIDHGPEATFASNVNISSNTLHDSKRLVKKFDGNNWVEIESPELPGLPLTKNYRMNGLNEDYFYADDTDNLLLFMNGAVRSYALDIDGSLSTEDFEQNTINIYPNPVENLLSINSNNLVITDVTVFDYAGKIVKTIIWNDTDLNLSDLDSGMYILRINTDHGILTRKLIKH
ncbi:T9SS type A sorting domain-containing protein [Tamlana sp. 2_MG-2023]|uniref:T9SS type A sorting domain-containing protein n=1 Tax=unclassified Tamlana TaxID=2614803 RepID=UPI0026E3EB44|nr:MULTISPECIES: T9SS type A sorting domain-containing protein [unclassified Tamlana]MDO6761173.1 T9SS type A sorting domain-containing protein [Tamlana sp. 2_MG-2023]MDO6791494.1 T9SS type A sorting domain-containing protein [Tamlana sp. 1_MG-2023]